MTPEQFIGNFRENTGRLPSQVELSKALKISPQVAIRLLMKASSAQPSSTPNQATSSTRITSISMLKIGMFIIAGFTFILSIYFTSLWFKSMFSFVIASLISVSMVSYMVLSPQVVRYVKGSIKIPLYITFLIALLFSMGSTVAGQYGKLESSVDYSQESDRTMYNLLLTEEKDLQESIIGFKAEKEVHLATLQALSETAEDRMSNFSYVATERNKVEEYNGFISEAEERLRDVRSQIKAEIEEGTVAVVQESDDFFTWVSEILRADRTLVQFWIYTLPAVFIDIIAALCLNLALYIKSAPD